MPTIRFAHNWNGKLNCKVFTTIRKHDGEKEMYYRSNVGKEFTVILNNETYCKANLIEIGIAFFNKLPVCFVMLDTGITLGGDMIELFGKFGIKPEDKVIVLAFERTEWQK